MGRRGRGGGEGGKEGGREVDGEGKGMEEKGDGERMRMDREGRWVLVLCAGKDLWDGSVLGVIR